MMLMFQYDNISKFQTKRINRLTLCLLLQITQVKKMGQKKEKLTQREKKRKGKAKSEEWQCYKNKFLRMKGEDYTGIQKNQAGRKDYSVNKSARKMSLPCFSNECRG